MANDLTTIMHQILARSLVVLRERCSMPRLVNSDFNTEAKELGDTIDVPIPTAVTVIDVTPAVTKPTPTDASFDKVQIKLDQWKQNQPFALTDKELVAINENEHFLPMRVGASVRALASEVNKSLFNKYKLVFGYVGTAGATPFSSGVTDATNVRKALNQQLCPLTERRGVVDFSAEANMLALAQFSDAEKVGSSTVKIEGEIGRKYGIDWYADDEVVTHTAGTAAGATTNSAGYAAGVKTITLASAGTGTVVIGDIITFAGHTQTYAVTAGDTDVSNGGTLSFYPGLKVALAASAIAITLKASHVVNLVFHRDAFALAMRPLVSQTQQWDLGPKIAALQDPQTGLVLRLEVSRIHRQVMWELDLLWGVELIRPELAARIAG
jgi:hypothetical protein